MHHICVHFSPAEPDHKRWASFIGKWRRCGVYGADGKRKIVAENLKTITIFQTFNIFIYPKIWNFTFFFTFQIFDNDHDKDCYYIVEIFKIAKFDIFQIFKIWIYSIIYKFNFFFIF